MKIIEGAIISTSVKKIYNTGYKKNNLIMPIGKEIREHLSSDNTIKLMQFDPTTKTLTVEFD